MSEDALLVHRFPTVAPRSRDLHATLATMQRNRGIELGPVHTELASAHCDGDPSGVRTGDRGLPEHTVVSARPVALRDTHERLIQTLWFEGIGIVLVSPLYGLVVGASMQESALLLLAVSLVMMAWAACFNTVFDWLEARKARRCASARPPRWRIVHAILFETTSTIVTWPLIVALTDLGWTEALAADLLLSLTYVLYGYVFHLGFDRLRPVR